MDLVLDNFRQGGAAKLVMLVLANWCDDRGLNLYPSIAAVADKACLSVSQARRVIHRLIEDGFLEVVGNHSGGAQHATRRYRVVIEQLLSPSLEVIHTPSAGATPRMDATPRMGARGENCKQLKYKNKSHVGENAKLSTRLAPVLANTLRNNIKNHTQKITDSADSNLDDVELPAYVDQETVKDFKRVLKKKRGTLTNALLKSIMSEAGKAGITLERAIEYCCQQNWATFKAGWYWEREARDAALPAWVFSAKGHDEIARKLHVNRVSTESDPVFYRRVRAAAGIDEAVFESVKRAGNVGA